MPVLAASTRHFNTGAAGTTLTPAMALATGQSVAPVGLARIKPGAAAATATAVAATVSGVGGVSTDIWLNRTAGTASRNGTASHTITFSTDGDQPFTPTNGRLLVLIVAGAVTMAWPGGWNERLQPINGTELSVATITASSTTSVTITHGGSNYAINWVAYEFPATTTWVAGAQASAQANTASQPDVTGLPGTAVTVFYAASQSIIGPGNPAVSATWTATENLDTFVDDAAGTDGVWLGVAYETGVTATSKTTTPTLTNGRASATERVTFALDIPSSGGSSFAPTAQLASATGSVPTASASSGTVSAPLAAFTPGTQVGVPTGTSLTVTSSLPAPDSTTTFTRTDPITGAAVSLTGVKKWSNREFTSTVTGPVPAGEVWWFDKCLFSPDGNNFFCIDTETPNGANSRLSPTVILTQCSVGPDGTDRAGKALATQRAWIEKCDVNREISGEGHTEDSWIGAAYCTVIESNFRAGVGTEITDPHADGVQLTDTGGTAFYRCWLDGGQMTGFFQGNSCLRVGTEFGAASNIDVFYCGFGGRSGNNVQFRSQPDPITNVRFRGNRWCTDGATFLHDFQQASGAGAMISEWTDNKIGINCTIGGVSYTAGDVISSPGV